MLQAPVTIWSTVCPGLVRLRGTAENCPLAPPCKNRTCKLTATSVRCPPQVGSLKILQHDSMRAILALRNPECTGSRRLRDILLFKNWISPRKGHIVFRDPACKVVILQAGWLDRPFLAGLSLWGYQSIILHSADVSSASN